MCMKMPCSDIKNLTDIFSSTIDEIKPLLVKKMVDKYLEKHELSETITREFLENFYTRLLEVSFGQGEKALALLLRYLSEDAAYIFDWDGTLTAFKYAIGSLLPCRDDEVEEYCKTHNLYIDVYVLKTMQFIISFLPADRVYILTRSELTVIADKNTAINNNFNNIKPDHIIHVQNAGNKLAKLRKIHEETGLNLFFTEDTFKTILDAEECLEYVQGISITEVIS